MDKTREKNIFKKKIILIFALSIAVRSLFIIWNSTGYYSIPQYVLSKTYFIEGYAIAAGYGYIRGDNETYKDLKKLYNRVNSQPFRINSENAGPINKDGIRPEMLHPPGMSILVATMNYIFGIGADLPIQILGMILDAISAVIVFLILHRYINKRLSMTAGLIYAIFPPLAYSSSVLRLPEGLLSFFILVYLASLIKAVHSKGKYSLLWYLISGIFLGLGCYLRPDYLLLPVSMAFMIWIYSRRFLFSIITMFGIQILVLTILLPWAYRNHEYTGRWIFTSSSVGATLVSGLAEFDNPWGFAAFDEDRHKQAIAQGFESAWAPEADQYFRALFIHSVKDKPTGFIKSIILRIPMVLFTPYDWGFDNPYRKKSFRAFREEGKDRYKVLFSQTGYFIKAYWDRLLMAFISFTSLLGIFLYFFSSKNNKKLLFLVILSPHVYSLLTHMITHFEPRFLLPSVFCWLIGFAYFLQYILNLCLSKDTTYFSEI